MGKGPKITRVEVHEFKFEKEDIRPHGRGRGRLYAGGQGPNGPGTPYVS